MKKFLAGVIFSLTVSVCAAAFASQTPQVVSEVTAKKIDAYFGRVKLVVNGKNVDKETLVYDDSTYIPLRAAAEVLGVEVEWDEKTGTAILTSPKSGPTATATGSASASPSASATGNGSTKTTSTVVSTKSTSSTTVPATSGTSGTSAATPTASGTSVTSQTTQTKTTSVSTSRN